MLADEILILKLLTVDRLAAGALFRRAASVSNLAHNLAH